MKDKHLAIIPARSGSKGLKDKNIKLLNGKPMIAYTIEAAENSGIYTDILVSTDSEIYAEIAEKHGAKVPFLRPDFLASDNATTIEVLVYTISKLREFGKEYEYFTLLQPTSPLRNAKHIREAESLLFNKNANSIISVCETDHSPLWCNTIEEDLCIDNFISLDKNKNRQNLKKFYRINGAIYMTNTQYFLKYKNFYHNRSYAYIMDKHSSVDIDDLLDFKFVSFLMSNY